MGSDVVTCVRHWETALSGLTRHGAAVVLYVGPGDLAGVQWAGQGAASPSGAGHLLLVTHLASLTAAAGLKREAVRA